MEKKTENNMHENDSFIEKETIRTTPEDGFVPERDIRPAAMPGETQGKARIGYSTTKSGTVNDPRMAKILIYVFSAAFFLIGVVAFNLFSRVFGCLFIAVSVFIFIKAGRQVREKADELEKQGQDVTIDSKEELEETVTEFTDEIKTQFQESAQETFSDDHIKRFIKLTLPIYAGMILVTSIALGSFVSLRMGIFTFLIMAAIGVLYYCVFLKLLVKFFEKKK